MPVYTYRCSNCGVEFEKQQSFSDQSLIRCPECGKRSLKKVYQPVGIVFKGKGFYATDHHSPSGQRNLLSEKSEESKQPAQKTETTSEKKSGDKVKEPAVKPEKSADNKDA